MPACGFLRDTISLFCPAIFSGIPDTMMPIRPKKRGNGFVRFPGIIFYIFRTGAGSALYFCPIKNGRPAVPACRYCLQVFRVRSRLFSALQERLRGGLFNLFDMLKIFNQGVGVGAIATTIKRRTVFPPIFHRF